MDLEAKELRLLVLGLKRLLDEFTNQMESLDEDSEEYVFVSNDAVLVRTMIEGFSNEYKLKYDTALVEPDKWL